MDSLRCIAVDWSGAASDIEQLAHIWIAVVESGRFLSLKNGVTRDEAVKELKKEIESPPVVIGLDFAFSFPKWYLDYKGLDSARGLWKVAKRKGETWLSGKCCPFWGRPGDFKSRPKCLTKDRQFRQTDWDHKKYQPKSVFQVYGSGAVGTGTIRGMPKLVELQDAKATIWPFDAPRPGTANVIEIYPRLIYGKSVTNSGGVRGRDGRRNYLNRLDFYIEKHWREIMIGSADAFDAGVSALVMSHNAGALRELKQTKESRRLLEGEIWSPPRCK